MKFIFFIIFLSAFFFQNNCSNAVPQPSSSAANVRNSNENEDVQTELLAIKKNVKYGFTAYIYQKFTLVTEKKYKNEKGKYFVLQNNHTKKTSNPIDFKIYSYPNNFEGVWSPNEEFLAFPCEIKERLKICIYKSTDLANLIDKQGNFQTADYSDFVDFYSLGKHAADVKTIEKWESDTSFSFLVRIYESKDSAPPFVYNAADKKFAAAEFFNQTFEAENKNGKITVGKTVVK